MSAGVVSRPTSQPFTDHGRSLMLSAIKHVKTQEMAQLLPAVVNGELKFIKFLSTASKKVKVLKVAKTKVKLQVTMAKAQMEKLQVTMAQAQMEKLQVTMAQLQLTMAQVMVQVRMVTLKKDGKDGQNNSNQLSTEENDFGSS